MKLEGRQFADVNFQRDGRIARLAKFGHSEFMDVVACLNQSSCFLYS